MKTSQKRQRMCKKCLALYQGTKYSELCPKCKEISEDERNERLRHMWDTNR